MAVFITKSDGTGEPFNPDKLRSSLLRAGAEHGLADSIAKEVEQTLKPGVTTHEIYRRAFSLLRDSRRSAAARYSLKRALLEFGPSGFPFEAYIARLLQAEGATTEIDQIVKGACVEHEVDVVARLPKHGEKEGAVLFVEAKFHNAPGFKTDLKTVLYVKARLDDIAAARKAAGESVPMRGLVVTNTKLTEIAVRYADCAGVEILSWEQPVGETLQDRIGKAGLYPVTALTTLNRREKVALLGQKIVLCSALSNDTRALASVGVSGQRAGHVLEEAGALCVPQPHIQ